MLKNYLKLFFIFFIFSTNAVSNEIMQPDGIDDSFIGNKDARAVLIVYSSPTCSHCIHFENEILPILKERYVNTGKLKIAIRPILLNSVDAIIYLVALSKGDEHRDQILATYRDHYKEMVDSKNLENTLREIAADEGIDEKHFNDALNNKEYIQNLEKLNKQATDKFGLKGTPTFYLNGDLFHYDGSLNSFSEGIDNVLNKKN